DGRLLRTFEAPEGARAFGVHVATAGDLDGDGHADVIIGAPGGGAGAAFVYSGKDGHLLAELRGERAGDRFGSAVAGGSGFLVIGAPTAGPDRHGRAYVYRGLPPKAVAALDAPPTGQALGGMFAAVLGDTDGDGVPDLFVSDWRDGAQGTGTGRIFVLSGATGRVRFELAGKMPGEGFGTSSSVAGDVDGDGRADLVVGAWQHAGAAPSGGKVTVFSGADGRVLATFTGRIPWETLGFDAVGLGDVDGDGTVDLLLASAWSAQAGFHAGRVLIVSSGIRRAPKAVPVSAPAGQAAASGRPSASRP
ncbi:MAG TPA: VCBS repeat-containing protein, partial [Holophagaceae bacterium]|nr:VCBS repeat-containing protein [Holophagaceae bacterium]